ncbi:protein mono-ADP-ribosyltransferase TIPARP-like isoform X2 [Entelurus aequoreus]|uniref:protein mono-ADP-ribosyltransferase TIPARP-like isoform X2 n=1 Tax=Entelurus aequoreus TaxID=161455 RepID=UPI002B1D8D87|nr:protein mono-ADP-ribosyltransferase TIPARP-like isoform X2 [Entelurus aequoreus]
MNEDAFIKSTLSLQSTFRSREARLTNPFQVSIHLTQKTSSFTQQPPISMTSPKVVKHGSTHKTCTLLNISDNVLQPAPPGQAPPDGQTSPSPAAQITSESPAQPPLFHTKSLNDVEICDSFLLGKCPEGTSCPKHHTALPFHWQLWCLKTLTWVDVQSSAQVLLERKYCKVDQDTAYLHDGKRLHKVHFDTMKISCSSTYSSVRRLSNSESHPYFPAKWRIYWRDISYWKEYTQGQSDFLLRKISQKEPHCSLIIDAQKYKVDFTNMTQINVKTGYQRDVRCVAVYRSPESMHPYLKTEPAQPFLQPNFSVDPLEDFTSWYPPVWSLDSKQDMNLVNVPACSRAFKTVQKVFNEGLHERMVDIVSIYMVQNALHWDKYQRKKVSMQKKHGSYQEPLERLLFHGTKQKAVNDICQNNFDPCKAIDGDGTYFAASAETSHLYTTSGEPDGVRHMFLAKVLVGKKISDPYSWQSRYDACINMTEWPDVFIVSDSCQIYPYFLISFTDFINI